MVCEVLTQPASLWRVALAASDLGAVGVEDDDVPGTEVVAVVPRSAIAGGLPEIIEIRLGVPGRVLVIPRCRACALLL